MFGYMLFKNGEKSHRAPDEFQKRAREDIENHIRKFKSVEALLQVETLKGASTDDMMDVDSDGDNNTISSVVTNPNNAVQGTISKKLKNKPTASPLLRSLKRSKYNRPTSGYSVSGAMTPTSSPPASTSASASSPLSKGPAYTPTLTYGSSPLRQTVADATVIDSSDECSSIDSGKSGCSLTHASAQQLFQQQQESLQRMLSRNSTLHSSLFSADANSLYTDLSLSTSNTNNTLTLNNTITDNYNSYNDNSNGGNGFSKLYYDGNVLNLNQALPTDFTDYYSPDLEVEKFSNGRPVFTKRPLKDWELNDLRSLLIYPELKPEWNNKVPEIKSPYPNIHFKIQIIPNYLPDGQIIQELAHSDIYKEAKFDLNLRLKTISYIVERARLRHKQILIDSFGTDPAKFNENNLTGDIQFDCYFKFEWRNIIENYLLNLGIEYQCRTEFKSRISKLKKITQEKKSNCALDKSTRNHSSLKNDLHKKVLLENKTHIGEDVKMGIWREVQSQLYKKLNMDGWDIN